MDSNEIKREQILKAANILFAKYGFSKTTLEDIAKSLGMKKNSLYYYFPSKEAIFEETVKENVGLFFQRIKKSIGNETSAAKKLQIIFSTGRKFKRDGTSVNNLTIDALLDIDTTLKELYKEYAGEGCKLIASLINEGIEKGEFKKCNAGEVAKVITHVVGAVEINEFRQSKAKYLSEIDFKETDKTISIILKLIIDGLKVK